MREIKRIVTVLTMLLIALMVLAFILENQQKATLSMLGWSTSQMPVSVFVVAVLIVGLLVGPVLVLLFRRESRKKFSSSVS